MVYFLLFAGILIFLLGIMLCVKFFSMHADSRRKNPQKIDAFKTQKDENGNTIFVRCPICDSPLEKSGKMHSKIFRPMNEGEDQLMTVMGCNNCFPEVNPKMPYLKRKCPVCKRNLSGEDFLRARLFNRSKEKKHVLVTGCNKCAGKK